MNNLLLDNINKKLTNVEFTYNGNEIETIYLTFDETNKVEISCEAPFADFGAWLNLKSNQ